MIEPLAQSLEPGWRIVELAGGDELLVVEQRHIDFCFGDIYP